MNILGLSSATNTIGAALYGSESIIAECSLSGTSARSEKLLGLVEGALKKAKIKISDIDAVAVTSGPGSYSGLRGGLATAKAMVATLDIPIISVSTLMAIAYNFINCEAMLAVAVNACRDDYNLALFGSHNGNIHRITGDMAVKMGRIKEVLSSVKGRMIVVCDGELKDLIKNSDLTIAGPGCEVPWAKNVAIIGHDKLKKKETDDYLGLIPSYSHKPNIREYKD